MDLKQLQHFLAVVEEGTVADAARRLDISQPALSVSIKRLERSVGTTLFVRSSDGMTLNAFGQALEERARLVTTQVANAERDLQELLNLEGGRVTVGGTLQFTAPILSKAVVRFHAAHPHVQVSIVESNLTKLIADVKTGNIDFAVVTLAAHVMNDPDLGHAVYYSNRRVILVAAAGNPIARRRHISARELLSAQWALPSQTDFFRSEIEGVFARRDLPMPKAAVEFASTLMAKRLIAEGPYVGCFSEMIVREDIERGALREVRAPELTWQVNRAAGAAFRRIPSLTPAAKKLVEIVGEVSREVIG